MTRQEVKEDIKKKLGFDVGDDIRRDIQKGIINSPQKPLTILSLPTSFGKSYIALNMLKGKTLIVISQLLHEQNWKDEATKWCIDLSNVTFVCYNSLKNYINESWETVIYDEAHRWADMWTETHLLLEAKYTLILSATLPDKTMKKIYGINKPKIWHISLEDAVEWNILPEPTIYVVDLRLDNTRYDQVYVKGSNKKKETLTCTYEEYQSKWKYTKSIKRPNLHIKCTQKQYYDLITLELDWAKERYFITRDENLQRRFIMLGGLRKKYLASLKTKIGQRLIDMNKDKRIVVFASSIEQAQTYCPNAVHSKNKDGRLIVEEFNTYKRNLLSSVQQLQESMNLVEPEVGIIIQINNSQSKGSTKVSTYNSQAMGRILRHFSPVLYLPIFKNTQDEVYLDNFKESVNNTWFKHIAI
jgi:superfamily II DNA or RNA helicase